jgi:hypothetical protein
MYRRCEDRRDDIPLLVHYFANPYARRMGKQIESIPKETMDVLSGYSWPGKYSGIAEPDGASRLVICRSIAASAAG